MQWPTVNYCHMQIEWSTCLVTVQLFDYMLLKIAIEFECDIVSINQLIDTSWKSFCSMPTRRLCKRRKHERMSLSSIFLLCLLTFLFDKRSISFCSRDESNPFFFLKIQLIDRIDREAMRFVLLSKSKFIVC